MTGSALMDFVIVCVGLLIIVYMVFLALKKSAPDPLFEQVGQYAVGGAALLAFLRAVKAVLFDGGAGGIAITPYNIIAFAIGLIVIMVVVTLVNIVVDKLAPAPIVVTVKYIIGAIALIALLYLAQQALFAGGFTAGTFRLR